MINKLWAFFILGGIFFFLILGRIDALNEVILNSSKDGFDLIIEMLPVMVLWSGIMKIAYESGLLDHVAHFFRPILRMLFPNLDKDSKALGYISSNIAANALGLGSVATPFGLKAMEELQSVNKNKEIASTEMITFLVLNTSGVTIIPTTVIAMRLMYGSSNPEEIIITSLIATMCSTIAGLTLDYLRRKK